MYEKTVLLSAMEKQIKCMFSLTRRNTVLNMLFQFFL